MVQGSGKYFARDFSSYIFTIELELPFAKLFHEQHRRAAVPMRKLCLQFSDIANEPYINRLQQSLNAISGILNCVIDIRSQRAWIYFDPLTANLARVRQIIEDAGLEAEPIIHQRILVYPDRESQLC